MRIGDDVCENGAQIVYFWGTWCPVCKITSPNVERISKQFDVLAVAVRSGDVSQVEEYMRKEGLQMKLKNDREGAIAGKNGVNLFPTIVFCKNKRVKMAESGYMSTFGLWLRALLFT